MLKSFSFRIVLLVIILTGGYMSIFTVTETEQTLVLQFGNPIRTVQEPGLYFKLPWQSTLYLDKRILNLNIPEQELIASDQKRLVVDAFARYRIIDPLRTYQRVFNELGANNRLQALLTSSLRQVLGREVFSTLLSGERAVLMQIIRDNVNAEAQDLGLEIVDVRIRRVDLPEANSNAIYQRMQTEREREAREARAEGREQEARVRAQADREVTVLLAESQRDAEILRGEGDARVVQIFADAYGRDEAFFEFYRSMQAYRIALGNDDTTLILSPDSEFFKFFLNPSNFEVNR